MAQLKQNIGYLLEPQIRATKMLHWFRLYQQNIVAKSKHCKIPPIEINKQFLVKQPDEQRLQAGEIKDISEPHMAIRGVQVPVEDY